MVPEMQVSFWDTSNKTSLWKFKCNQINTFKDVWTEMGTHKVSAYIRETRQSY